MTKKHFTENKFEQLDYACSLFINIASSSQMRRPKNIWTFNTIHRYLTDKCEEIKKLIFEESLMLKEKTVATIKINEKNSSENVIRLFIAYDNLTFLIKNKKSSYLACYIALTDGEEDDNSYSCQILKGDIFSYLNKKPNIRNLLNITKKEWETLVEKEYVKSFSFDYTQDKFTELIEFIGSKD